MSDALAAQVVRVLAAGEDAAAWAGELVAALGVAAAELDPVLDELERAGGIAVQTNTPPDIHLQDVDLRTVALVREPTPAGAAAARAAAQRRWERFVREFLASHRCC